MKYYSVYIANTGRKGLRWSDPCATIADATTHGKKLLDCGQATMTAVITIRDDGTQEVGRIKPESIRKIIGHWEEFIALAEKLGKGDAA